MNARISAREPMLRLPRDIQTQLTASEMVLFALLTRLDHGKGVRSSVVRLSGACGLSAPTVHTALRGLEQKKLLCYTPGMRRDDAWCYRVLLRAKDDAYILLPLSCVKTADGNRLRVACQLAQAVNRYGMSYVSFRALARVLHMAVGTVLRCVQALREDGVLEKIPRLYRNTRARRCCAFRLLNRGVPKSCMLVDTTTREHKVIQNKNRKRCTYILVKLLRAREFFASCVTGSCILRTTGRDLPQGVRTGRRGRLHKFFPFLFRKKPP